jgi:hypothetical protein
VNKIRSKNIYHLQSPSSVFVLQLYLLGHRQQIPHRCRKDPAALLPPRLELPLGRHLPLLPTAQHRVVTHLRVVAEEIAFKVRTVYRHVHIQRLNVGV